MSLYSWLFGQPQAATQSATGGKEITTSQELEHVLASMNLSASGVPVTPTQAMRVSAVYASVRLISGTVANMPTHIMRRVDERTREIVPDHPLWTIFHRAPNQWQTPSQFKRMMQAHILLRGNAFALVVRGVGGAVTGLIPLHPDRMKVTQLDNMRLEYEYRRKAGNLITFTQDDVFHLVGLTLDGVMGVSPITFARETIGLSLAMEQHGAQTFRNGARPSNVMTHPGKLGVEGRDNLRKSLDEYRSGGEHEGKSLILEEGMDVKNLSMTAEDAQWIESRKFSRTDIAMFFGVPPHMIGDTEPSTSWGSGLEQQSTGYVTYTAEDHLTTWEETIGRDLISDREPDIFARFQRSSLVRGDITTRWDKHVKSLQWGVASPNEVRAMEDMNPREDGDIYYPPPNMTADEPEEDEEDEPANAT